MSVKCFKRRTLRRSVECHAQTGPHTEPSKVFYDSTSYNASKASDRLELALLLYNFVHILSNEKDDRTTVLAAIQRYDKTIDKHQGRFAMKTFDDKHGQSYRNNRRRRNEESSGEEEDRDARTNAEKVYALQLRPHGYEVEPRVIVTEGGTRLEPLFDV
jgi:hypothetical protein